MNTHTPIPWHTGKTLVSSTDPAFSLTSIVNEEDTIRIANVAGVGDGQSKANAAFIVRSCNNYQQMLDTLKLCFEEWPEQFTPCYGALKKSIQEAQK